MTTATTEPRKIRLAAHQLAPLQQAAAVRTVVLSTLLRTILEDFLPILRQGRISTHNRGRVWEVPEALQHAMDAPLGERTSVRLPRSIINEVNIEAAGLQVSRNTIFVLAVEFFLLTNDLL